MPLETVRAFQDHGEVRGATPARGHRRGEAAARRARGGRRRLRRRRRDARGRGRAEVRRLVRRAARRDRRQVGRLDRGVTDPAEPARRRAAAAAAARAVRRRHLRRLGRPDEAQADPRAVRARLPQAPARAVRRPRRRAHAAELEGLRRRDEEGGQGVRARPVPPGRLGHARGGDALRRAPSSTTRRARIASVRRSRSSTPSAAPRANRLYYLAVPPQAFAVTVTEIGERRAKEGWVRLIVEKPFGHDLASARELERAPAPLVHGGRDLPHRPLPRQGDGAEHAGAAVRERHLRADLEPAVHRPRPDHGRRVDGDRGPGGLLRVGRRDPRHLPEPPPAAARADRDGAADRLHRRLGAQREGEGAEGDAHPRAEVGRPRPVRAGVRRGRRGARLPRGAGGRPRVADGDVHRGEALRRQLALGRHAVLRPRRQAAGAARDDDRDPVPARAAPAVRGDRRRRPATERPAHPRAAGRGRLARDRGEGARSRDDDPDRAHGLPLRRRVPHGAAGGVRAPDPRRDARRRDPVHARGRGGGAVEARRRDPRRLAARPAELPELRERHAGGRRRRTT